MDDLVDASLVPERVIAMLSSFFGGLGASLAALGLYGLLAYTVTRRTNEIGIRIALGATQSDISRMVLRGALGLVCAGLVIGVPLALLSRRAASRVVTDLRADSMWPFVLATADDARDRSGRGLACPHAARPEWSRSRRCGNDRPLHSIRRCWCNLSCPRQLRRAASMVAMSIFFMGIIASKARFATPPRAASASVSARGVIRRAFFLPPYGFTANGPTSGFPCVFASVPSSAATPRAMAAVSLPAWKQVKSGRSRHANGPHSRTPALMRRIVHDVDRALIVGRALPIAGEIAQIAAGCEYRGHSREPSRSRRRS